MPASWSTASRRCCGLSRADGHARIGATLTDVIERIPPDWRSVLAEPLAEPWFTELCAFVALQRAEHTVYPSAADVFAALHLTRFASVRAVILGQARTGQPVRTGRFMTSRLIALVEHPAVDERGRVEVTTLHRLQTRDRPKSDRTTAVSIEAGTALVVIDPQPRTARTPLAPGTPASVNARARAAGHGPYHG